MKKLLKVCACFVLAFVCVFGFSACKTKISDTTTDTSKTVYNDASTNGGITAVYDGYLYFVNGTKTKDGGSLTKNTRSAICRVKIDGEGKIDENTYEVVVGDLVGYDYGSIHFFGDFMYYTTPNSAVNYQDTVLYNQTKFMRYDLVNKKSYNIYTTKKNDSSEKISYAYYVSGENLDLVVYESASSTITSVRVGEKPTTNYVIEDVKSCVLSENYGTKVIDGVNKDANNFVFYTKGFTDTDFPKTDKVYRTSASTNDSVRIYNDDKTVSILSIRKGKLFYTVSNTNTGNSIVYAQTISGADGEVIDTKKADVISYKSFTNIVFYESEDLITAVCHDTTSSEIIVLTVNESNKLEVIPEVINTIKLSQNSSSGSGSEDKSTLDFIGLTTIDEEIKNDDPEAEKEYEKVTYLLYTENKVAYKIEIMRNGVISKLSEPIKLSTSKVVEPSNYLIPEAIGNYLYIFANEEGSDGKETGNVYLYRVDLSIDDDSKEKATMVGMKEE